VTVRASVSTVARRSTPVLLAAGLLALPVAAHAKPATGSSSNGNVAHGQSASAPGHDASGPGNSENAPGHDESSHGNSATAPGHDASGPGNSENAPGHDGSGHGNSGNAPGHDGTAPGNSENAPGHAGSSSNATSASSSSAAQSANAPAAPAAPSNPPAAAPAAANAHVAGGGAAKPHAVKIKSTCKVKRDAHKRRILKCTVKVAKTAAATTWTATVGKTKVSSGKLKANARSFTITKVLATKHKGAIRVTVTEG
jgi:hypothetical protein